MDIFHWLGYFACSFNNAYKKTYQAARPGEHMQTMKKLFPGALLALLLALTFALGGCGDDLNVTEEDVIKRTREEMALMAPMMDCQAGSIKADLGNRGVIMENVVMSMQAAPDMELRIAKITSSGMDVPSYEGKPGDRTDIESMVYEGIQIYMEGEKLADLAEYRIEGMSMAYRDLLQAMRDNQSLSPEQFTLKVAPYMSGYTAKKVSASGLKISQYEMVASIDSMEARDLSLGAYGPAVVNNFKISERGREIFSLAKSGYASMELPKAYQDMVMNPEQMFQVMFMLMEDPLRNLSPMSVKGFYLENLKVTPEGQPLVLDRISGDFAIKDGSLTLTSDMKGLSLSQALLKSERSMRILAEAAGGKDLLFDGVFNMDMAVAANNERKTTLHSTLSDKNQGNASLDMAFTELMHPDYGYYSDMLLHSLDLKVDDNGLVDVLLAFYATTEFGYYTEGYDSIRQEFLESLAYLNAEIPPALHDGLAKFVQLVKNGGKFRFAMNPAEPVDMDDVEDILRENPAALGCTFEYSAPSTPKR